MTLAIVTGATGGLGLEASIGLARAGLEVLLTGRNPDAGAAGVARVQKEVPGAHARFARLDTSSLASVAAFAATVTGPVAVLLNNAGVMALPRREETEDGFERQLATNHLGHVALTARLLPHLRGGRVVNVSSLAHRRGRILWDDLQEVRRYDPWTAYAQSKLAMLMFGLELQRRSDAAGWGVTSIPAHPGWSATRIVANGVGRGQPHLRAWIMQRGFNALAQSAAEGARPLLHAALDPAAQPGGYYGPCCWGETRGDPAPSRIMVEARDPAACRRLWDVSEELVGARFGG